MVRIANTPVEWERIRRVLSRIKDEENENGTFPVLRKSFRKLTGNDSTASEDKPWPQRLENSYGQTSTSTAPPRDRVRFSNVVNVRNSSDGPRPGDWPSSEWIRLLIENVTNQDYYADDDDDDFDYVESNEIDDQQQQQQPATSTQKIVDKRSRNASNVIEASSKLIIPNSALPNFAYRRVTPDSQNKENSAYIAVSVISAAANNETRNTTQVEDFANDQERHVYEKEDKYRNLERLETRRRHSRRKYHKT